MAENAVPDMLPGLKLLAPEIPIPGYSKFIGSYLIYGSKRAVVDPGPSAAIPGLLSTLTSAGIWPAQIDYLLLTHIHIDHAGGTGTLCKEFPHVKVVVHPRGIQHLVSPHRLWEASLKTLGDLARKYGRIEPVPQERIIAAEDGMTLDLGGRLLKVLHTPGHAVHHVSYFEPSSRILLAGEAAGVCNNGSIRPATPPPFRLDETVASVDKLIALKPEWLCYGHYGCYERASERLSHYRKKLFDWQRIIQGEVGKGTTPEQILDILRSQDRDLDYLNTLSREQYGRESILLLNTIGGMAGA